MKSGLIMGVLSLSLLISLFGFVQALTADAPVEKSHVGRIDQASMSHAAGRFRANQPRHWRHLLLRH
ncbi:MAG: hypothetical protein KatS3mg105_4304 [Gemmatales bacterium]|nr:MAG: hypothetical protein KatS3mg105_4304 [Gemmatales bacterium]